MMEHRKTWITGSLPQWLVVALLAVIGFFGHRTIDELDMLRSRQAMAETRITMLEGDSRFFRESISELKASNHELLMEFRSFSAEIRKRQ